MSVLSGIETKGAILPPRLTLYGGSGAGKTTFLAGIPDSVTDPVEEGEGILTHARFPKPETIEDVYQHITALLNEDHKFRAYGIDTVDHLEPLIWNAVCEERSTGTKVYQHIEDFGYAKGYSYADPYWKRLLRGLDALRREKGMVTVLLAHAETKTLEDPVHGAYDKWQTKLHKRANALIHEWADIVGFAEIERTPQVKEGKRDVKTVTATGRRILSLADSGGFIAKNRYSLPPRIELSWGVLREEIGKSFAAANGKKENETKTDDVTKEEQADKAA